MIRFFAATLRLSALMALIGCAHSPPAMAISGPDTKSLAVTTFELSGRTLRMPLPTTGLSKDVPLPRTPFVTKIDIDQTAHGPVMLVDDLWDWRGPLLGAVHGSIGIKVAVVAAPPGVMVTCENSLRQMVQAQIDDQHRKFVELGGQERYMRHSAIESQPRHLSGATALIFGERGRYNEDYYIVPLSESAYLKVGFILLSGDEKYTDWQADADQLKSAIIQGMRFEGGWPELHGCAP